MSLVYNTDWKVDFPYAERGQLPGRDSGVFLSTFADDAAQLSLEEFSWKHGEAFLIRVAQDGTLTPAPEEGTQKVGTLTQLLSGGIGSAGDIHVYSLGQLSLQAATIGRTAKNLVCINDMSVSVHHAMIHLDVNGGPLVTDIGSRNGTVVGDVRASNFVPYELPFGKRLVFGAVDLLLMPAEQFAGFVKLLMMPG